ncbi:putative metalloprotease CJM1_0395 family protein [Thiomicrorhabdus chilensis]|uniref:putative metalloprotease CJM1_0395 family protein n=1 Tax=Thiomicrorhabdus chilensis TaxID=63656 RepID=UPI0006840C66|nr:putative metalloprotease CJM1_0395 family protein [Thiomicrorhabdus chilensis]
MISANINDSAAFSGVAFKTQASVFAKNQSLPTQPAVAVVDPTRTQVSPSSDSRASSSETNNSRIEPSNSSLNSTQDPAEAVQQVINQLKSRDAQVRAHERAHLSVAGAYATGGASYVYQVGPDGQRYAIGGEVGIDTSPVAGDPQATLQKAMVVQRAALAPAEPSSQDMRVASLAVQMAMQARMELSAQTTEQENQSGTDNLQQSKPVKEQGDEMNGSISEPLSLMPLAAENRVLQGQRQEFNLRLSLQYQT